MSKIITAVSSASVLEFRKPEPIVRVETKAQQQPAKWASADDLDAPAPPPPRRGLPASPGLAPGDPVRDYWQLMQWLRSYSRIPLKLWPYKVGVRLALHWNRQTGLIDPTYDTLAKDLRTSRSTIERAMKVIKKTGAMKIRNTGKGFEITLIMPPDDTSHADASDRARDASTVDVPEPTDDTSPADASAPGHDTSKQATRHVKNGPLIRQHADVQNGVTEKRSKSAPPGALSAPPGDSFSYVEDDPDDVCPF